MIYIFKDNVNCAIEKKSKLNVNKKNNKEISAIVFKDIKNKSLLYLV